MTVAELRARLGEFPDYWEVPDVLDVRAVTKVTHGRDATTGARIRDCAVVVVIC